MAHNIQCEMEGNSCFPLHTKELPENFARKSEVELSETQERREESLKQLRELILGEKDLCCRTDDEFLLMFLRPKKFCSERAFVTITNLFKLTAKLDFFLRFQSIDVFHDIINTQNVMCLPYRDPKGRSIFLTQVRNWNPDKVTVDTWIGSVMYLFYNTSKFPMTQVNGVVGIIDQKGFDFHHWKHITPNSLRISIQAIQDCLPLRVKGIHVVNESVFFKFIWMLAKNLLPKKLKNRIFLHGEKIESLHQYFPPAILPLEYGGKLDISDAIDQMKAEINSSEIQLLEFINSGYKEGEKIDNMPKV